MIYINCMTFVHNCFICGSFFAYFVTVHGLVVSP
uniref:Uncharacterized protein n=1 Tax=Rhizophora mucronata TaxID=61149 RepID=A0A2P2N4S9_RHIMU